MENIQPEKQAQEKNKKLKDNLLQLKSIAVAFSGGVDSTFLLKTAHDILGDDVIAVTAKSCLFPGRELREAEEFCRKEGIRQIVFETDEFKIDGFRENPENRCYICKKELFQTIRRIAKENGVSFVVEGSNQDDMGDYRPGLLAVKELGIKSPLREAGLTKAEIRILSKEMKLPTWEKPSFACLATRFVYGETITEEKLSMVERAEQLLLDMGFNQVRVRIHGEMARIEVLPEEFDRLTEKENCRKIVDAFKSFGFTYVTMDLTGYRTGSMNETIRKEK